MEYIDDSGKPVITVLVKKDGDIFLISPAGVEFPFSDELMKEMMHKTKSPDTGAMRFRIEASIEVGASPAAEAKFERVKHYLKKFAENLGPEHANMTERKKLE